MTKPSQRKLLTEVTLAVPADEAWKALKDPEKIREWFGYYGADYSSWGMDSLETLDDEIKVVFGQEATYNEVRRSITWEGGDEFVLSPKGENSILEVFVVRPALQSEMDWTTSYDPICEGWISFVQQLRFYLDRHRDDERSTIFMTGLQAPLVYSRLNLPAIAELEPGAKYSLMTAMNEHLTGDVWYKTHHQMGFTVDTFGDGLLIVAATPVTDDVPDGGADVIITTFLDDKSFGEVQQRWGGKFTSQLKRL